MSGKSVAGLLGSAAVLVLASHSHGQVVFASGVVSASQGAGSATWSKPLAAVGAPDGITGENPAASNYFAWPSVISPFSAAYQGDELYQIGKGGHLTLQLGKYAVLGSGMEIGVISNVNLEENDWNNLVGQNTSPTTTFGGGRAVVRVSADGLVWKDLGWQDFLNPALYYVNAGPYDSAAPLNPQLTNFGKPFEGNLSSFDGKDWNGTVAAFRCADGTYSGGGTWLDLRSSGLTQVGYIDFSIPDDGDPNTNPKFAIDAVMVANNSVGSVLAEPANHNYWAPAIGGGGDGHWNAASSLWAGAAAVQGSDTQAVGRLYFSDNPGTITLDGTVVAGAGMQFSTNGYKIVAGTPSPNLSLTGASAAANTITVDSAVTATLAVPLTGNTGMTKAGPGTLVLSGDNSGLAGGIIISAGTLQTQHLSALGDAATGTATIQPGATLHVDVPGIHLAGLTVNGTVTTTSLAAGGAGSTGNIELGTVDSSGNTVVPGTLTLGPTGLIDLQDRMLIVHYAQDPVAPSILDGPATAIKAALVQGRNVAPGGVFDGPWTGTVGITSTRAMNDFSAAHIATGSPNTEFYALGYGDTGKQTLGDGTITNKMLINDAGPSFFDPTANGGRGAGIGSTVFVRYTRVGDATMDGIVGNNDVTVLGLNFDPTYNPATNPNGPKQWYDGDFNYNGIVDNNDVTILGLQFDPTNTSAVLYSSLVSQYGSSFAAAFIQGVDMGRPSASLVPEPGTLTLLGVGALALIRRRRA